MALTRSQRTFLAQEREITEPVATVFRDLPGKLLAPEEGVYALLVGDIVADDNPILVVTERRVLEARLRFPWGWRIRRQAQAADITGAEYSTTLFSGKLTVRTRRGREVSIVSRDREEIERVTGLVRHLVAGGAPPRID